MFYLLSKFGFVDNYGKEVLNGHFLSKLCCCAKWRSTWFQDILLSALRDGSFKGRWHWMLCTQLAGFGSPTCSSSVEVLFLGHPLQGSLALLGVRAQWEPRRYVSQSPAGQTASSWAGLSSRLSAGGELHVKAGFCGQTQLCPLLAAVVGGCRQQPSPTLQYNIVQSTILNQR